MGSDRARVTYDGTRQYRAVVAQQGRVTVEADANEACTIDDEEKRKTLLDIVGRAGPTATGYEVTETAAASRRRKRAGTRGARSWTPRRCSSDRTRGCRLVSRSRPCPPTRATRKPPAATSAPRTS